MEIAVSAARWVVGKALGPITDGVLEAWAASEGLGPNVGELRMELLYAQAMLNNTRGREIDNPALNGLLQRLRDLVYDADDVLDELEYFRIQDQLDGTDHASADVHEAGCVHGLVLNARHTARTVVSKLKLSSGSSREANHGDPDELVVEDDAKQGCLSRTCSCGGRVICFTSKSHSIQSDQNGGGGRMSSKVASGARRCARLVGKRLPCCSSPCVIGSFTTTKYMINSSWSGYRLIEELR